MEIDGAVVASLRASGAKRELDLGCGEGKLIRELLKDKQFDEIVGLDVSVRSLEAAQRRMRRELHPQIARADTACLNTPGRGHSRYLHRRPRTCNDIYHNRDPVRCWPNMFPG